jgi:hypothetical protein
LRRIYLEQWTSKKLYLDTMGLHRFDAGNVNINELFVSTQHTPGPWKLRHVPERFDGSTYCVDWSDDQEEVAEIVHGEANARLIAAAPDLLEALQACFEYGAMTGDDWVADRAEAAIAKATGEAA